MSVLHNYTKDEWILLHSLPAMVGAAVLAADESGMWGTTKESFALTTGWAKGVTQFPDNALIRSLLTEKEDPVGDPIQEAYKGFKEDLGRKGLDQFTAEIVRDCGRAADLLDKKSTEQEAGQYKVWVLAIGRKVAAAAREKGPGKEKVSLHEEALLNEIASALRHEPSTSG